MVVSLDESRLVLLLQLLLHWLLQGLMLLLQQLLLQQGLLLQRRMRLSRKDQR